MTNRLARSRRPLPLRLPRLRRSAAALTTAAALTIFACGGTLGGTALAAPAATRTAAPSARTAAAATTGTSVAWTRRLITADGVTQWLECGGTGPVTVVVISGLGASHPMWDKVISWFGATTRTCISDRPGLGSSPARPVKRITDAGLHAAELHDLLTAGGEKGPFVVVGHSYGGLVARSFVTLYRSQVAGLMLIEGVAPWDDLGHYWGEAHGLIDMNISSHTANLMRLGSIPLVVESAADPNRDYWGGPSYGESAAGLADWRKHQALAARLSTNAEWVIVRGSAHVIQHDYPWAVIAGLQQLVHAAVAHTRLPPCGLLHYGTQRLC